MRWDTIIGLCSLKALVFACLLAPVPATTISAPAHAQFQIIIPNFPHFGPRYRGPRYYGRGGRSGRYSRRGRGRGEGQSTAAGSAEPALPARGSSSSGKVRGTVD
jgi:hypothetical protein